MPQFIEHIDAIARKPKRDVLYLEFLKAQRASPLGLPACGRRDLRDGGNQAYDEEDQCPQGVSVMHASATGGTSLRTVSCESPGSGRSTRSPLVAAAAPFESSRRWVTSDQFPSGICHSW